MELVPISLTINHYELVISFSTQSILFPAISQPSPLYIGDGGIVYICIVIVTEKVAECGAMAGPTLFGSALNPNVGIEDITQQSMALQIQMQ